MSDSTPSPAVTFNNLVVLYRDMKVNPDDLKKRLAYFEALADARLDGYYVMRDKYDELQTNVRQLRYQIEGMAQNGYDHLKDTEHHTPLKMFEGILEIVRAKGNDQ